MRIWSYWEKSKSWENKLPRWRNRTNQRIRRLMTCKVISTLQGVMLSDKQRKIRMKCQIWKRKLKLSRSHWKSHRQRTSRMKILKSKLNKTRRKWKNYKNECLSSRVNWHKLKRNSTLKRRRIDRWEINRTVMAQSQDQMANSPK